MPLTFMKEYAIKELLPNCKKNVNILFHEFLFYNVLKVVQTGTQKHHARMAKRQNRLETFIKKVQHMTI